MNHNRTETEVPKLWGAPGGALLVIWGARVLFIRDIYFERNMGGRYNIHFGRSFIVVICMTALYGP
jgi:hypothetical protein